MRKEIDDVLLRRCAIEDLPALLSLLAQLGYPTSQQALEKRFKQFIKNPGYGITVACINQTIVGCIAWSSTWLFISDNVRVHIECLVVDKQYHGLGIGKKLIGSVEQVARNKGPGFIDLTCSLRRAKDGSHAFYQQLGYQNNGEMATLYLRKKIQ